MSLESQLQKAHSIDVLFEDRRDAGRRLAARLMPFRDEAPAILALPRGGVPVGYEIARALAAPLDVIVVRKLGAPNEPELGIGAVVDGDSPLGVLNEETMRALGVSREYLDREVAAQLAEIHRRQSVYRSGRTRVPIAGRTAIIVDDGLATGSTMRAAIRSVRRADPARLVLAVPVAPADTLSELAKEVDETVCLATPEPFGAVGFFYRDFGQTTDDEVTYLLDVARRALDPHAQGDAGTE
ncbi:MAG: phosphoribosyltransferase [Polyangiaceae bacterium UTPRO1]|jgi:putative phosphoribosyl transferase|nr:phosphoribosyltransferase [Myxococcales bacterium]OQY66571.1 MAG: phosphoribosyltransferase [Polyangiaceae bacterium UTPRO1]